MLDRHTQRRIAVEVPCDPRTVVRWARGQRVHPLIADRIRQAVAELGLELPPRIEAQPEAAE